MSSKIYVVDGALLKCNQGMKPAKLQVTQNQKIKIQGKFKATDMDNVVPETFFQCKLKPTSGGYLPCVPALQKWTKTTKKASLGKSKKFLYDCSETMCATGGKITVAQHGQINTAGSMKEEFKNIAMLIPGAMLGNDKVPKVVQSYWMDEDEQEEISDSDYAKKPKYFVMTQDMDTGEKITIEIEDQDNLDFKEGEKMLIYSGTVKADGSAILSSIEIKEEWLDTEKQ